MKTMRCGVLYWRPALRKGEVKELLYEFPNSVPAVRYKKAREGAGIGMLTELVSH